MSIVTEILKQSAEPLIALAAAGVSALCGIATRWLWTHTRNAKVQGILLRLNDAATTSVAEMEQSVVKALKAAAPDGKLPPGAAAIVRDEAVKSLKTHLGPKGVEELKTILGVSDVEKAINSKIESAVASAAARAVAK